MSLVFLHPVGLDGQCWQFLTSERLANAVRYDMLWHGERKQPAEILSLEAMADDVVEHNTGDLDLVGLSLGGAVAVYIALRHPDRVRSLMLCASGVQNDPSEARTRAEMVMRADRDDLLEWAVRRWFTPEAIGISDHPGIAYVKDRLRRDTREQFAAGWLAIGNNNTLGRLREISVPTTVLHPLQDHASLDSKEEIVKHIRGARLVTLPGPHMVHLERPAEYEHAVLEHLDWVEEQLAERSH